MKPPYLHSALLTSLVVVQVSTNTANGSDCPGEFWADLPPGQPGLDGGLLEKARDYALTVGGSGIVIHRGKAVMRWEDQRRTYDLKSTSKSIGGTVLGLAMKDGFVRLDDKAAEIHPEFAPPCPRSAKPRHQDHPVGAQRVHHSPRQRQRQLADHMG